MDNLLMILMKNADLILQIVTLVRVSNFHVCEEVKPANYYSSVSTPAVSSPDN